MPGTGQYFQVPSNKKFEKYGGIASDFFEFIGEDPYGQIDDEVTVSDFAIGSDMIEKIIVKYGIGVKQDDFLVDIFERIDKSSA